MGFGNIIAGLAAVTAILLAAYVFTTGAMYAGDTLSEASRNVQHERTRQLESSIRLVNVSSSDGLNFHITLNNSGNTKIRDYSHMDIIVRYHTPSGDQEFEWAPYSEADTPSSGEWIIEWISPDSTNPGIFDPGEQMGIWIKLNKAVKNKSTDNWLQITAPTGVSSSKYFTG